MQVLHKNLVLVDPYNAVPYYANLIVNSPRKRNYDPLIRTYCAVKGRYNKGQ